MSIHRDQQIPQLHAAFICEVARATGNHEHRLLDDLPKQPADLESIPR